MRNGIESPQKLPWRWGTDTGLQAPPYLQREPASSFTLAARAVYTAADTQSLYLWLCQLRRAPYSYDWIDNFFRQSPRTPDPSLTNLSIGQTVMTIFDLVDFQPHRYLTLKMKPGLPTRIFGSLVVHYSIVTEEHAQVLRGDLWMASTGPYFGRLRRFLLAWGDIIMMRKQLLTLTALAEQTDMEQRLTEQRH
ncbi:SRPBCC family protein [Micrococcoides hystricis]|uniref:SRPBCC family protein n=1 Tax=Micrococcoides hystricis TaxID=1572761 RepID=A0ABV6PAA5_9MICC